MAKTPSKEKQTGGKRRVGDGTPGPGRKKGVPNKMTTEVKQAILAAFDQAGGVDYLVRVANDEPKVFCSLLGKIVPAEISGKLTHEGETILKVVTGIERAPNE